MQEIRTSSVHLGALIGTIRLQLAADHFSLLQLSGRGVVSYLWFHEYDCCTSKEGYTIEKYI